MKLKKIILVLLFATVIIVVLIIKNKAIENKNEHAKSDKKPTLATAPGADIGLDVVEFVQWFRKSEICKIKDFYHPCPWGSRDNCLDTNLYEKALAILESKIPISSDLKKNVDICIDFHKKRNAGVTWTSGFIEDEIQSWKEAHPNQELPKNFGEGHWMDGLDDNALSPVLMMNTELCPIDPVRSFAVLNNELEAEIHFELHPVNNITLDLVLMLVRRDKHEAWHSDYITTKVVK